MALGLTIQQGGYSMKRQRRILSPVLLAAVLAVLSVSTSECFITGLFSKGYAVSGRVTVKGASTGLQT